VAEEGVNPLDQSNSSSGKRGRSVLGFALFDAQQIFSRTIGGPRRGPTRAAHLASIYDGRSLRLVITDEDGTAKRGREGASA